MPSAVLVINAHLTLQPAQKMGKMSFYQSQIISFYCIGVYLDLCSYHCQAVTYLVYIYIKIPGVWL